MVFPPWRPIERMKRHFRTLQRCCTLSGNMVLKLSRFLNCSKDTPTMDRQKLIPLAKYLLTFAIFAFLGYTLYSKWSAVTEQEFTLRPLYLVPAILFALVNRYMQAWGWLAAVRRLGYSPAFAPSMAAYFISQAVKYVPGKMMLPVFRVMLCDRLGIRRAHTITSVMVELVMMVASGSIVFFALLPFMSRGLDNWFTILSLLACCIAGLVGIHPKVMNFGMGILMRILKKDHVPIQYQYRFLLLLLMFFIAGWLVYGLSAMFTLLAVSQAPISGLSFPVVMTAAFAISWVLGFLSFLTPGGLGVREGVLTWLLTPYMPVSIAIVVALISRLIWVGTEILAAGITYFWRPLPQKISGDEKSTKNVAMKPKP